MNRSCCFLENRKGVSWEEVINENKGDNDIDGDEYDQNMLSTCTKML